jgi:hypothetical protein
MEASKDVTVQAKAERFANCAACFWSGVRIRFLSASRSGHLTPGELSG